MTSEITNDAATEDDAAGAWLKVMDLQLGQEVMIIPVAGQGGGFQGTLIEAVFGPLGPLVFIIEKIGSPRCTINWANVAMVTRVGVGNTVSDTPIGGGQALAIADLEEMADRIGIDIPDEVRKLMDTSGA